ncbi:6-O-methylguanine DNA methyltransferase, DNA binding domain protein [Ancylostoma caninum]|uniref:Large ribosomal subunit protein P2 n=1 Tax=Ancylostoma caninum TaxID=29170 RepID=A0A368H6Z8_ANCCA|nr:6-O-methylguanine DNA methyltransferase, DNA binding domain protein [Ancylostoma caninum]
MRYVSAYLLALAGGNQSPKLEDLKNILGAVGVDTDVEAAKLVISRLQGKSIEEVIAEGSSGLVTICVAEIDEELCALLFDSSNPIKELARIYPSVKFVEDHIVNVKNITKLLRDEAATENLPISKHVFERCSDFRKEVYNQLMRIPRGTTRSYAEIAKLMGRPTAYRAVAQACRANVLPVVIPCHRVVASDGSLGGFSSGIETKRQLLKMESVEL